MPDDLLKRAPPEGMTEAEWALRHELAQCYRLFHHLGWTEMIFNHITARVPGADRHFLINPFGLHYAEVRPENLVKIDTEGRTVGASAYPVNPAGSTIHTAVHAAREDAHCVMHTHTTSGVAVACQAGGLDPNNFYSAQIMHRIAYHDFEGVTVRTDEQARLVASLGDKDILMLRNHGLLVCGPGIPEAFQTLYTVQRACDVQMASTSMGGRQVVLSSQVLAQTQGDCEAFDPDGTLPRMLFDAMVRRARAGDPSFDF